MAVSRIKTVMNERKRSTKSREARRRKQAADMVEEATFKVSILPLIDNIVYILNDENYSEDEIPPSAVRIQIMAKYVPSFELYKATGALDDFDITQEDRDVYVFQNRIVELL